MYRIRLGCNFEARKPIKNENNRQKLWLYFNIITGKANIETHLRRIIISQYYKHFLTKISIWE